MDQSVFITLVNLGILAILTVLLILRIRDRSKERQAANASGELKLFTPGNEPPREEIGDILDYMTANMDAMLAPLTDAERQVIKLRFGLEDGNIYKTNQIAALMKLDRETVRELELDAMDKMDKIRPGKLFPPAGAG